jgi:hypothetical protein
MKLVLYVYLGVEKVSSLIYPPAHQCVTGLRGGARIGTTQNPKCIFIDF